MRKLSEEHKRKIGEASLKSWQNPEYRKHMSIVHKGQKAWNKGIPRTNKDKKIISEALKGRKLSREHKEKMSEAMKGRVFTKEWKDKISKANQERFKNPEYRMKMSKLLTGIVRSEETRRKISIATKGRIPWMKGKKHTKETKEKISKANKGLLLREKNPNWMGGISFEPYGIVFNEKLKEQIRMRDRNVCQICNSKIGYPDGRKHPIHHRDYDKKNNKPKNLITLCFPCHLKTNGNREYWQNYFEIREVIL